MEHIYGEELKAVVLYGSAVGQDYSKRFSDFNIFCVLTDVTPALLAKSNRLVRRWVKDGNPVPYFFYPEYIERSLDVFPMEFLDMKDSHEVLVGRDPLEGIRVDARNLRHQCESELKGKLVHLRNFYAANCHKPKRLAEVMVEAFPTFLTAMRGMLRLLGERPPEDARAVVELTGNRVDVNPTPFYDVIEIRRGESLLPRGDDAAAAFERYLTEVEALTRFVDELQVT